MAAAEAGTMVERQDCRLFHGFGEGRPMSPPAAPELFCVELRTTRWAELVEWYCSAVGLTVLMRVVDDGYALLAAGTAKLAILARESPGPASGRISLGFEVTDVDAVHGRLVAAGADATAPRLHPEGFRELVVHDPDGNTLRVFSWPQQA
jgi:predicted enzyme related to lactoylglutathione lyase